MTNPTYIITKREKCEHDPATFTQWVELRTHTEYCAEGICPICGLKGYNDTEVDLLDVFKALNVPFSLEVDDFKDRFEGRQPMVISEMRGEAIDVNQSTEQNC